jgi:serine O-acetyltransferase
MITEASLSKGQPVAFWASVRADITRFQEEGPGLRPVVRGMLSQGFQALFVYRVFRWCYERSIPTQPLRFLVERFTEMITGISLPAQARIGKGLRIYHFGGIIVNSEASIGEYCSIYQGVTLGDLGVRSGSPQVGDHVIIGAGAKLLGHIEIGNYCHIGANAVVRTSVPAECLAVGVPAVIKQRTQRTEVSNSR